MASIRKRPNGKWRARYYDPDGKEHARHFDRKVDAERFVVAVQHAKNVGDYVDPGAGKVTFRVYAEQWTAMQVHRPTTAAQVEANMRNHVLPFLGDRPLGSIRPSEVQAWVKGRADVLAPRPSSSSTAMW